MSITVVPGDPSTPEAAALLQASRVLMDSLFTVGDCHYLSPATLAGPDVLFFIAAAQGQPAGCGALALRDGYGEIKAMYVDPTARGQGVGTALLARLESEARARALPALRLETGDALTEARRLYTSAGFTECGPFGDYPAGEISIFMEKSLT